LEYACYRARELAFEGKKSIIWSSFVNNVELVARRLIDLGAEYIHGGVDAGDEEEEGTREQKIARFHEDENCFVLVANPAACGEGISLHTVCHNAIYLDRNYNAAQFLQSQDRIHRLGLAPNIITNIEILVAPDTIDESVDRRLATKIGNMARVLDDKSLQVEPEVVDLDSTGFTREDFNDFLAHVSEPEGA
jgi:SNF2 family DNA or RNA helicase